MSNTILVTGANGNIGSQIIEELSQSNADFIAGVTHPPKTSSYSIEQIDFGDKKVLQNGFKKIDTLFLLFPMIPGMEEFARNAVEAAKASNIKHIVRSSGAGGNSASNYKMAKVQGTIDDYIKESGIPYTLTKPASFMQNFANFYANDIQNGTVYNATGNGKTAWVDVRDIAAVNARILMEPKKYKNEEIIITGGQSLTFKECIEVIAKEINKDVQVVDVSIENAEAAMKDLQMPEFIVQMMTSMNQLTKMGALDKVTHTVQEIVGRTPIPFQNFVRDHINQFK